MFHFLQTKILEIALEEVEEKLGSDAITEDITESEVYNHARKEIIKSFNGENIGGLYLVESLHQVAVRVNNFILNSDYVDDVLVLMMRLLILSSQELGIFQQKECNTKLLQYFVGPFPHKVLQRIHLRLNFYL